ncbi:hypothetical protein MUP77_01875 [Candidatus Bathyarchaeota archaeon]|nr:hypothetical protein [Candidatus Bathyarchaeota archaeon]
MKKIKRQDERQWQIGELRNANGKGWIKSRIRGLNNAAIGMPYLVLVDLNTSYRCAPELINNWISKGKNTNLLLRVAVTEVESWILASGDVFCKYLGVRSGSIPKLVDHIPNPKEFLISLAKKTRKKNLRIDIVPRDASTAKIGPDYNGRLIRFVTDIWDPYQAAENSGSLKKTIHKLENFVPVFAEKEN